MTTTHVRASRYRELLRLPSAPRLIAGNLTGRLVVGLAPLAIVLSVRGATGSYVIAGLVIAAFTIAAAIGGPVQGRLIDRLGQTRVLLPAAIASSACLVGLYLAVRDDAPPGVMVGCAAVAGATIPTLAPCMRALWARALGSGPELQAAYSMESVAQETVFILGPILVGAITAIGAARDALLLAAAVELAGTLLFATARPSRSWRGGERRELHWAGPLRAAGMRTILLGIALVSFGFGALEFGVAAFAIHHGHPGQSGLLLALWSLGSLIGGLLHASRNWTMPIERRYLGLLCLLALTLVPPMFAPGSLALGLFMVLAGLAIAPWIACCYLLIERVAPRGTVTEAFTWQSAGFQSGGAFGSFAAGVVIQHSGVMAGLAIPVVAVLAATALSAGRIGGLRAARQGASAAP